MLTIPTCFENSSQLARNSRAFAPTRHIVSYPPWRLILPAPFDRRQRREQAPPRERREIERLRRQDPIAFAVGPTDFVVGMLCNISPQGLGLFTERHLKVGSIVGIHVPAGEGRAARYVPAEVKHATAQHDGGWILGCKLQTPLTPEEISAIGQRRRRKK